MKADFGSYQNAHLQAALLWCERWPESKPRVYHVVDDLAFNAL